MFFVTFTCNGDWPEICSCLQPGQTYMDVPIVVCRVFKQKLSHLMSLFCTMFPNAGRLLYNIQCVKFQKCGLPHAHILLKYLKDCVSVDDINHIISDCIPEAADDAEIVCQSIIHPLHNSNIISTIPPPKTLSNPARSGRMVHRCVSSAIPNPSKNKLQLTPLIGCFTEEGRKVGL